MNRLYRESVTLIGPGGQSTGTTPVMESGLCYVLMTCYGPR